MREGAPIAPEAWRAREAESGLGGPTVPGPRFAVSDGVGAGDESRDIILIFVLESTHCNYQVIEHKHYKFHHLFSSRTYMPMPQVGRQAHDKTSL